MLGVQRRLSAGRWHAQPRFGEPREGCFADRTILESSIHRGMACPSGASEGHGNQLADEVGKPIRQGGRRRGAGMLRRDPGSQGGRPAHEPKRRIEDECFVCRSCNICDDSVTLSEAGCKGETRSATQATRSWFLSTACHARLNQLVLKRPRTGGASAAFLRRWLGGRGSRRLAHD